MDWKRAALRPGPRILSDHVSRDVTPDIERENMTWIRVVGRLTSEVSALNDYTFPIAVGGVNQHIMSASAIRNIMCLETPNTTSDEQKDRVAAFLLTRLDKMGNPVDGGETTLQKFIRLFQPYIIVNSTVESSYAAMIGYNGSEVTGLFAGSNLSQSSFHPASVVQTDLRLPSAQLSCMPECQGTCGIFAVFDTDFSPAAKATEHRQYGVTRVRYVVAPTRDAEVLHTYELMQKPHWSTKSETEHYTYEIAIRRLASIPMYNETSLLRVNPDTVGVPEYHVDFSTCWYYRCYMVCLDEKE